MRAFLNARGRYNKNIQHDVLDTTKLEEKLNENTQYHVILTLEESREIIDDLKPRRYGSKINGGDFSRGNFDDSSFKNKSRGECFSRGIGCRENEFGETLPNQRSKKPVWSPFHIADPISIYAGNVYDSRGVYDVIREFKRIGVTATQHISENGSKYIHISGYAGFRRVVTGTRYGASHPKILSMGIGQQGLTSGIVNGIRFCIVFSVAYRTIEYIFKDEYTLAEFIGNITVDMAKTAIIAAVSFIAGTALVATALVGGSIIAVSGIVFVVGFVSAIILAEVDEKYGISEKIISYFKREFEKSKRIPKIDSHYINDMWNID